MADLSDLLATSIIFPKVDILIFLFSLEAFNIIATVISSFTPCSIPGEYILSA